MSTKMCHYVKSNWCFLKVNTTPNILLFCLFFYYLRCVYNIVFKTPVIRTYHMRDTIWNWYQDIPYDFVFFPFFGHISKTGGQNIDPLFFLLILKVCKAYCIIKRAMCACIDQCTVTLLNLDNKYKCIYLSLLKFVRLRVVHSKILIWSCP